MARATDARSAPNSSASRAAHPLLGAEDPRLVLLELRRHVALGGGQGLPPLVVGGDLGRVGVGDLQVVAEHLVEADLERGNAGALALTLLERGDVLPAAVAERAQVVELAVEARADHATIAEGGRRTILEAAPELGGEIGEQIELVHRIGQGGRRTAVGQRRRGERAEPFGHVGQAKKGVAQRAELAGSGPPGRGATRQPLDVPHAIERLAQTAASPTVAHRHLHGVESVRDRGRVAERRQQPLPEEPAAHGRHRRVHRLQQGATARAGAQRLDQLEIAAGHLVEPEKGLAPADEGAAQVGQAGGLELDQIAEQGSRRADRRRVVRSHAESVERREREPAGELFACEIRIELPALAGGPEDAVLEDERAVGGNDDFRRSQTAERLGHPRRVEGLEHEFAGAEIDRRQPRAPRLAADRDQEVVPGAGEPALLKLRARRDGLDDLATHEAARELRVLHLLAHGNAVPGADELTEVVRRGLHRHAGQGNTIAARGERDLENACRELGVLVEHLVEVADPIEEDGRGMLRLHLPPVLEHGRGGRVSGLAAHGGHGRVREGRWGIRSGI